jgi:hypothetical protein
MYYRIRFPQWKIIMATEISDVPVRPQKAGLLPPTHLFSYVSLPIVEKPLETGWPLGHI